MTDGQMTDSMESVFYKAGMNKLVMMAKLLDPAELAWMLETLRMCHTLGPIQYPTEYQAALQSGSIEAQTDLVVAAMAYRRAYAKVQASC